MKQSMFDSSVYPTHNKKKTQSVAKDIVRHSELRQYICDHNVTCLTTLIRKGVVAHRRTPEGVYYDDPAVFRLAIQPVIESIRNDR